MQLKQVLEGIPCKILDDAKKTNITDLQIDSRECKLGSLFFCLSGENFDGHDFAKKAVDNGAVAIVANKKIDNIDCIQILVDDVRATMSLAAKNFCHKAVDKLKVIGITGTNGKTTTTFLIKSILETSGHKVGLIGTTANYIGKIMLPPKLTTPDPIDLHRLFLQMQSAGCEYVVMEASAHAIYLKKLRGIVFDSAILTNITIDHLDFFGCFDNYKNAKLSLFTPDYCKQAVFNMHDIHAKEFYDAGTKMPSLSFAIENEADVMAKNIKMSVLGSAFELHYQGESVLIELDIAGKFNIENALASACSALQLGFTLKQIADGLNRHMQVPGRFNVVNDTRLNGSFVVIDYAHTPDGLEKILNSLRQLIDKKIICVFGCGGNRDKTKRPIMGQVVTSIADYAIVTSDNPRFEKPQDIINDIIVGIHTNNFEVQVDRKAAIKKAISIAKRGDVILIAGKGCEDYQEINGIKHPFLDAEVVDSILQSKDNEDQKYSTSSV